MKPFTIKDKQENSVQVACGKCPACVKRRVSAWSFRLLQEEKKSLTSYFVTLTYGTSTVPITKKGMLTLDKRHLQLFFKRLRKVTATGKSNPIKYYAVGEYGSKVQRPHYHIILFNADVRGVESSWYHGQCHFGTVTGASIGYTLQYISKKRLIPAFDGDDRKKEFSVMSKGLGAEYVNAEMKAWHFADLHNRMHCVLQDGKKIAMPRYFKDKIYAKEQKKAISYSIGKARESRDLQRIQTGDIPTAAQLTAGVEAAYVRMEQNSIRNEKI